MKGVIVAAGYGTRFLPVTKTVPKEMLPLFDRPIIDFILDEFEEAGISECIVLTSRRKKVLDDYLDREIELEEILQREGKISFLDSIRPRKMNFIFIRQTEMKGTGHALLMASSALDKGPFVVAYPDDVVLSSPGITKNMIQLFETTGKNILAVRKEFENISRYGVIQPRTEGKLTYVEKIIEKPKKEDAPSNYVSLGRYVFTGEMIGLLMDQYSRHKTGEFYHIDAISKLAGEGKVLAYEIEGVPLDTGEPLAYMKSILTYMQYNPALKAVLDEFVRKNYPLLT